MEKQLKTKNTVENEFKMNSIERTITTVRDIVQNIYKYRNLCVGFENLIN